MIDKDYKLTEAGFFTLTDLLDFKNYEWAKGNRVKKIWLTKRQLGALVSEIVPPDEPRKVTGMKLVDFWSAPKPPVVVDEIEGIEIGVEDE